MQIAQTSLIAIALLIAASASGQEYRYAVIELAGLTNEGQWAGAVGVNSGGDVVGFTSVDANFIRAVLWPRQGGIVDLGTLGGDYSGATSINDHGAITGWAGFQPGGSIYVRHAFIYRNGRMESLGTLGGESSYGSALNDIAQIAGQSEHELNNYSNRAFFWENGEMNVLTAPREGRFGASADDINDLGHIVGRALGAENQATGTLWINQQPIDLGSLSGRGSTAYAINDLEEIVGDSITADDRRHAVRWTNLQIEDIHTSSIGAQSMARGINNLGQIVGDNNNVIRPKAWILNPGEDMIFLDDLVPPRLRGRWRINRATHINDAGQIPVTADLPSNPTDSWALLLSPVSPTMAMAAPSPGTAGTSNTIAITDATPGARVTFLYARHGGGTRIPGCDLQQNALQLDNPTVIGTAIANQNGVATITRPVPLIARGQTILFQAVVQNECAISQLVVHTFD